MSARRYALASAARGASLMSGRLPMLRTPGLERMGPTSRKRPGSANPSWSGRGLAPPGSTSGIVGDTNIPWRGEDVSHPSATSSSYARMTVLRWTDKVDASVRVPGTGEPVGRRPDLMPSTTAWEIWRKTGFEDPGSIWIRKSQETTGLLPYLSATRKEGTSGKPGDQGIGAIRARRRDRIKAIPM